MCEEPPFLENPRRSLVKLWLTRIVAASRSIGGRHGLVRRRQLSVDPSGDERKLAGAQRNNVMIVRSVPNASNPLSEFALTILGTLGLGLPMALVIIWICS